MGALVAGLYAAGKLEAYTEWALTLNKYDIFKLLDVGGGSGLIAGNKIMAKLEEWLADIQIEDLPIPYSAVAVDIERDRKSTRLNSSHVAISYAVFCLKKKKVTAQKNTRQE